MRIHVVDNGGQWTHREWRVLRDLGVETEIVSNDTPIEELGDVDGVVLSGGGARIGLEDGLGAVGDYLDETRWPVLGICAGHQYMAQHFGGEAEPGGTPEYGKSTIRLEGGGGRLLGGLPEELVVWESHNDEVTRVPDGFRTTASSGNCPVQAMEHEEEDLYGLQFHPEVDHTEHGRDIFESFVEICKS